MTHKEKKRWVICDLKKKKKALKMSWAGRTEGSKVREKENDKVSMVPVHSCETLSIQGY